MSKGTPTKEPTNLFSGRIPPARAARKAKPGEALPLSFWALPGKAWNAEKERRIAAFFLGAAAGTSGTKPEIVSWKARWDSGPPGCEWQVPCSVPGVIATALAAWTSGGNHRNDARHWLRSCASCRRSLLRRRPLASGLAPR